MKINCICLTNKVFLNNLWNFQDWSFVPRTWWTTIENTIPMRDVYICYGWMAMVRWCSIRCSRAKMLIIWIHLVLVGPISNFRFLSQSFLWNYLNYFLHFKCLEPHLLKLYWKSMELVQVSQLQVTVSRLLIEWVCLVMYLRREVSPIRTFPSLSYAPEYPPYEDGKIISLCNSQTEICSKYFCFLLTLPMSLTKIVLFVLGDWIT